MGWSIRIAGKRRLAQAIVALAGLIIFFTALKHLKAGTSPSSQKSPHTLEDTPREYGCGVHIESIRGQEVVWELPRRRPTGVIFFAHGCHHSAGDLWPPSPGCPNCLGLPEEMRLRQAALRQRLALIAISSLDRVGKRCWGELRKDGGKNVAAILREWIDKQDLQGVPLYTMGASSGAQMALTLPRHMRVRGIYSQVRGVENKILKLPKGRLYPPTAFVHMPRDEINLAVIANNIAALRKAGTPVLEVQIHPRPVTVEFLTARSPLIDRPMAQRIITALLESGVVGDDGMLLEAPRPVTERWAPFVQLVIGNLSLKLDESHVGELVNLAWAKHELVSDEAEAVMAWLQGDGKGGLEAARERAEAERKAVWEESKELDVCERKNRRVLTTGG